MLSSTRSQPKSKTETHRGQEVTFEYMGPKIISSLNVGMTSAGKKLSCVQVMASVKCYRESHKLECKNPNLLYDLT